MPTQEDMIYFLRMKKKTILFLTGPSCSGKSTTLKDLADRIPDNYLLSYDKLKIQLHGYDRDKHKEVMRKLSLGYLDVVCSEGFFILLELWRFEESDYLLVDTIAKKHGYEFTVVHFTASKDVLTKRCRERISSAISNGIKVPAMAEERYIESFEEDQYLPKGTPSINTSSISNEDVTQSVLKILEESK